MRELFFAGLQRLYAAYSQNEAASVANGEDAHDQELKRTLQTGTKKDHEQGKRLLVVFEAVGLKPEVVQPGADSGVLEAGREEIAAAEEGMPRDLCHHCRGAGICAGLPG